MARLGLAVNEGVQHGVEHAEVVVSGELLFHIDQVFVHGIESASEEAAEVDADGGVLGEEIGGIGDEVEAGGRGGAHGGGVGHGHEGGEVAEDGAGFTGFGDDDVIFDDFDAAFDEEVDVAGVVALGEDEVAGRELADGVVAEGGEEEVHHGVIGLFDYHRGRGEAQRFYGKRFWGFAFGGGPSCVAAGGQSVIRILGPKGFKTIQIPHFGRG